MKKISYLLAFALMLCTLCACNNNDNAASESDNFSTETVIEGNFSSEMIVEPSTDVTIVEMPQHDTKTATQDNSLVAVIILYYIFSTSCSFQKSSHS